MVCLLNFPCPPGFLDEGPASRQSIKVISQPYALSSEPTYKRAQGLGPHVISGEIINPGIDKEDSLPLENLIINLTV